MEKFNNTTLFTGYLKQLLHNYNLPKYKVYTREQAEYSKRFGIEREDVFKTIIKNGSSSTDVYPDNLHYVPYIKDGQIQEYINGKWIDAGDRPGNNTVYTRYYDEGIKILNYTKNLKITGNSYDSYTHEYLGDYLRFQRDYNNINLMPLYNCFSNRPCDKLSYQWEEIDSNGILHTYKFDTSDTAYKIYMLPVKLFQKYTIAIDSDFPVEICCGMYGAYQDKREKFALIPKLTYKKFDHCKFSTPVLYSKLGLSSAAKNPHSLNISDATAISESSEEFALKTFTQGLLDEIGQNEPCLKMFIKVSALSTSTITILEGDYCRWNDRISKVTDRGGINTKSNKSVLNFENLPENIPFNLITSLQLLRFNTKEQHPFADRLIEYLIGNAITSTDEINKNIARVQKALINGTVVNTDIDEETGINRSYHYYYQNKGFWDNYIKYTIYDYINNHYNDMDNCNTYDINHDILGYVDKDAEKYYYYHDFENDTEVSIANVELDDEEVL